MSEKRINVILYFLEVALPKEEQSNRIRTVIIENNAVLLDWNPGRTIWIIAIKQGTVHFEEKVAPSVFYLLRPGLKGCREEELIALKSNILVIC